MTLAAFRPHDDEPENRLPSAVEAEQALIGAALFDNEVVRRVSDRIRADHFYDPVHQRIWAAVVALVAEDRAADPITVKGRLGADEGFAQLGGTLYLGNMVDRAYAPGAEDHAREVFDAWCRRAVMDVAARARKLAEEGRGADGEAVEPFAIVSAVLRDLEGVLQDAAPGDQLFTDARTAAGALLEDIERQMALGRPRGLSCGLACIDRRLGGLFPEDLVVIGGRPGMGKTALLGNIMAGAARENPTRLFAAFSLEMSNGQLMARTLSRLSGERDEDPVHYERIHKGSTNPMEVRRLHELRGVVPENLLLRDRPGLTVEGVARAVWALKRKGDLGAIGIDYLQIMRRPLSRGRNEASVIGDMTSALKTLAREARVCIILLSQLNRSVESRDDKRPNLGDLRESGAIEQDADVILFPFREVYYLQKNEPKREAEKLEWEMECANLRNHLDVIIAKNRHGAEGMQPQHYRPEVDLITDKRERVQ